MIFALDTLKVCMLFVVCQFGCNGLRQGVFDQATAAVRERGVL